MNGNDLTRLNEIICPICHRDSVIEINEFKVLFECFEGHESSDICLDEFGGTRMVGESDVLMDLNLENCCGIHGEKKIFIVKIVVKIFAINALVNIMKNKLIEKLEKCKKEIKEISKK